MISNAIYKGTTTVGVICKDGVVLGTERRATMGHFIASKTAKKIYRIGDRMALTTAGSVGDAQFLARLVKIESDLYQFRREKSMSVDAVAALLSNILNQNRYFPYFVQLIVGGVDEKGSSLYSIDPVGGAIKEKELVATGSGSLTAYGVLEDRYSPELTVEEAAILVVRAINSAMKRDSASGDGMDIVKITKDAYNELTEDEINKILNSI
jgi:proteasome beta subunit